MLVAQIGRSRLSAAEVEAFDNLLGEWDKDYPGASDLTTAAVWPDMIKCTQVSSYCAKPLSDALNEFDTWHFSDKPYNPDKLKLSILKTELYNAQPSATWLLNEAMQTFTASKSKFAFNLMLRFSIHILGDLHQPLHATEGFFKDKSFPDLENGDEGGNAIKIANLSFATNLHAVWDAAGGIYVDNWPLSSSQKSELNHNASTLQKSFPTTTFPQYKTSELAPCWEGHSGSKACAAVFEGWGNESFDLATKNAYPTISQGCTPTAAYMANVQQVSMKQITLAGYRLGDILKVVFTKLPPPPTPPAPTPLPDDKHFDSVAALGGASELVQMKAAVRVLAALCAVLSVALLVVLMGIRKGWGRMGGHDLEQPLYAGIPMTERV
jgi:hypothetical protein